MRTILLLTSIFCLSVFSITAQEKLSPVLNPGDVTKFIKTFPMIQKDLKNFGIYIESKYGNMTVPETFKAQNEYYGILKKHGWDENFNEKSQVIMLGYTSLVYDEEMKKSESGFEKSLKEIDSNTQISEEMKVQLKEQITAAKGVMKEQQLTFRNSIHKQDLVLVKPHIEELKKMFENE